MLRHLLFFPHSQQPQRHFSILSPCPSNCPVNPALGVREQLLGSQPRAVLKELLSAKSATGGTWATPEFRKSPHLCHQVFLRSIPVQRTFVQLHHESESILPSINVENFCGNYSNLLTLHEMNPPPTWKLYLPFDSKCTRNISLCFIWETLDLFFLNTYYRCFCLSAFCLRAGQRSLDWFFLITWGRSDFIFLISHRTFYFVFHIPPAPFFR